MVTSAATKNVKPSKPATAAAVPNKVASTKKTAATRSTSASLAKPAAQPSVAKTVAKSTPAKLEKSKKPKLVRDSFTIPKAEYAVLEQLKERAAKLAHPVKKSETLRAGIKALAAMSDTAFLASLKAVPTIKTGRPSAAAAVH